MNILIYGSFRGNISFFTKADAFKWNLLTEDNEIHFIGDVTEQEKTHCKKITFYSTSFFSSKLLTYIHSNILLFYIILFSNLDNKKIDLILFQDPLRAFLYSVVYSLRIVKTKYLVEAHGDVFAQLDLYRPRLKESIFYKPLSSIFKYVTYKSLRYAAMVRTVSSHDNSKIKKINSNIYVLAPFIDIPIHSYSSPRENRVVFVGALINLKNGIFLIDEFAKSKLPHHGFDLEFIGDGVARSLWECHANQYDNIKVKFSGSKDKGYINKTLYRSAVFVLPSLSEGLPRALIEAMFTNIVCFSSNVGGVKELITDYVTGVTFDPNISNSLARLFDDFLENQDKFRNYAYNAAIKVNRNYSHNAYKNGFNNMLHLALEE